MKMPKHLTKAQLWAEIERCHARLEIDHCYVMRGKKLIRKPLSWKERLAFPDAVACRDDSIELMRRK